MNVYTHAAAIMPNISETEFDYIFVIHDAWEAMSYDGEWGAEGANSISRHVASRIRGSRHEQGLANVDISHIDGSCLIEGSEVNVTSMCELVSIALDLLDRDDVISFGWYEDRRYGTLDEINFGRCIVSRHTISFDTEASNQWIEGTVQKHKSKIEIERRKR